MIGEATLRFASHWSGCVSALGRYLVSAPPAPSYYSVTSLLKTTWRPQMLRNVL